MNSVDEQNHHLLHICKICKKVYKDRTGLMDHQRLQHPQPKISVSQQVQQLAMNMNRYNNRYVDKLMKFYYGGVLFLI